MTLHTVNLLPDDPRCSDCISLLTSDDAVLFHGSGAWVARNGAEWLNDWLSSGAALHALHDDVSSAGLEGHIHPDIAVVQADGFLALSVAHTRQQAWF